MSINSFLDGVILNPFVDSVVIGLGILFFVYILVRTGSIAYYRTRSEYDRGEWKKPNGE